MFQYADTGYTFQSGMLHVYFINENSLAVKMCVRNLALKYCICCCLFCSGSIRHLFCTQLLSHFSIFFFSWGSIFLPFFPSPSPLLLKLKLQFLLFSSGVPPTTSPWWGGRTHSLCWNYLWDSWKGERE